MGKRVFKINDKNTLYKKLIKLPDTYYKLENNGDGYTVYSHDGSTNKVKNFRNVRLKWENDKIVLKIKEEDGGEKDYIIEQEAIMDRSRDDTISKLQTTGEINIAIKNFESVSEDSKNYCIALYPPGSRQMTGVLNFINFNDKSDPVLQKIKGGEEGSLYFTIEDDNIYISDKDGNCLEVCPDGKCYRYQYTKDKRDALEISEISTVLESLTKAEQCGVSEATESSTKAEQGFTLQKGKELSDDIYEAKIMSSGRLITTLPKFGYHMLSGELVIYDHITKEEVKIPRDFHYLKIVKSSNNDDYELTFCNFLGNEFFEYKKYDPQYSNAPDEYRYISLNCIKKEYKPNFCKV